MKKIVVLLLLLLGLLASGSAPDLSSSAQVFNRVGMAEADGGG